MYSLLASILHLGVASTHVAEAIGNNFWEMPVPVLGWTVLTVSYTVGLAIIQVLGWIAAGHAIMNSRTPQASLGWAVGLSLLPVVALPLYLVFGQSRFTGYTLSKVKHPDALGERKRAVLQEMNRHRTHFRREFSDLTKLCEVLSELPTTSGNRLELLVNGERTFSAIFEAMRRAQKTIVAQFYIVKDDELGRQFQQELLAARSRGVQVFLLFDGVGSKKLPLAYIDTLREAGVQVAAFVTNRTLGVRFQINFRNHRKLVLIDGEEAFTGGLNVGDEYMGRSKRFGPWRDTHVRVSGPGLLPLYLAFCEDWHYATGKVPDLAVPKPPTQGSTHVLSFVSGPADEIEICPVIYLSAIREARERIWIASPYLVPDTATRLALQHAALRGVEVRILLPGMADHILPWYSSFSYYPAFHQAGIKIYRMREGFMHQKILLVDHDLAMVGSINFDHRSFLLNFEHAVMASEPDFARAVADMLKADFSEAREENLEKGYALQPLWFRFMVRAASLTAPEQ